MSSPIAAVCCSTAAEIVCCSSSTLPSTSAIVATAALTASVSVANDANRAVICSVASPVWLARSFTSLATTANPRPASPARAASMVALSASIRVWLEILDTAPTTEEMSSTEPVRWSTRSCTSFIAPCARTATDSDVEAVDPTSRMLASSSSAAALTAAEAAAT
ncbi:MAG: hypothetical protein L6367_13430 [Cellulomonas sp.]|nr:hypothetical protein [Cellulomonas sp.]